MFDIAIQLVFAYVLATASGLLLFSLNRAEKGLGKAEVLALYTAAGTLWAVTGVHVASAVKALLNL